jgi:SAM-dependent methyltransferase
MKYKSLYYPESRFGGFSNVDGTVAFYTRVNALLRPSSVVLDVGCGRGAYAEDPVPYRLQLRVLRGKCARVIGIDVDPVGRENPFIDEFRPIKADRWPLENDSVDICIADNVLEHVHEIEDFFSECRRVLKPGGYLCIRTPNLLSYFGLVSWLVPNRSHVPVLRRVKDRVKEQDVFPTAYHCNTIPALRRKLDQHGFDHAVYGHEAEPSYLSFSRFAYFVGILLQRFTPNLLKVGIHAFGRKKGSRQDD